MPRSRPSTPQQPSTPSPILSPPPSPRSRRPRSPAVQTTTTAASHGWQPHYDNETDRKTPPPESPSALPPLPLTRSREPHNEEVNSLLFTLPNIFYDLDDKNQFDEIFSQQSILMQQKLLDAFSQEPCKSGYPEIYTHIQKYITPNPTAQYDFYDDFYDDYYDKYALERALKESLRQVNSLQPQPADTEITDIIQTLQELYQNNELKTIICIYETLDFNKKDRVFKKVEELNSPLTDILIDAYAQACMDNDKQQPAPIRTKLQQRIDAHYGEKRPSLVTQDREQQQQQQQQPQPASASLLLNQFRPITPPPRTPRRLTPPPVEGKGNAPDGSRQNPPRGCRTPLNPQSPGAENYWQTMAEGRRRSSSHSSDGPV